MREKSVYALAGALLLAVWAAAPLAGTGATFVTVITPIQGIPVVKPACPELSH